eukprot:Hpha_TRINITY_DN16234_c0_g2::TRINITY_DN16234_c0_g2_i2::g.13346::m.13346
MLEGEIGEGGGKRNSPLQRNPLPPLSPHSRPILKVKRRAERVGTQRLHQASFAWGMPGCVPLCRTPGKMHPFMGRGGGLPAHRQGITLPRSGVRRLTVHHFCLVFLFRRDQTPDWYFVFFCFSLFAVTGFFPRFVCYSVFDLFFSSSGRSSRERVEIQEMAGVALFLACLLPMVLAGPTEKWTFTAKTNLTTVLQNEVVVSHGGSTVFVVREPNHIVAVDAQTGKQKWEYTPPTSRSINPALVSLDDSLLFAIPDSTDVAEIVAISTVTGQLVRTFSQKGDTAKPALSPDGKTLYVSMYSVEGDHVAAYDIATGTRNWGWRNPDYVGACDVMVGPEGNIYVASYGHFAFDSRGKQLWSSQEYVSGGAYCDTVFDSLGTRAAVVGTKAGVLFLAPSSLGDSFGDLYAMNASTGNVTYMIQPSPGQDTNGINSLPSVSYPLFFGVYQVGKDDDRYRLFVGEKLTGKQVASYQFEDEMIYGPTPPYLSPSGDTVFVAGDVRVYALSTSAQVLWSFDLAVHSHFSHRVKASPTEQILFVTDGPTLRAINY